MMVRLKQAMELIYAMREKNSQTSQRSVWPKKWHYTYHRVKEWLELRIGNGEKGAHNAGPIISKSVHIEIHATKKMQATHKRKWDVMKSLSFTISFISSIFIFINDFQWGSVLIIWLYIYNFAAKLRYAYARTLVNQLERYYLERYQITVTFD